MSIYMVVYNHKGEKNMALFVKVFAVATMVIFVIAGLMSLSVADMIGVVYIVGGVLSGAMCWLFASTAETVAKVADKYLKKD